jgi:hypothetical protein
VDNATGNITLGSRLISTVNGAADAPPVRISGTWFAGTSANSLPALYVSPTGTSAGTSWSASGTGIGVNAPAAFGGNLLDLQVNGTSIASITSGGLLTCGSAGVTFGTNNVRTTPGYNNLVIRGGNVDSIVTGNDGSGGSRTIIGGYLGFTDQALTTASLAGDLRVTRDAANTLAQRNGTAAQTFRVYNTFTDASNYERGFLRWSSNVFEVGPEAAGTGTARPMRITAATLKLPNLPTYADNAAATTGGLVAGDVYKTATGELRITV